MVQIKDHDSDEHFQQFSAEVNKLAESATLETTSFEQTLHKLTTDVVAKHETSEIEEQKKVNLSRNQNGFRYKNISTFNSI